MLLLQSLNLEHLPSDYTIHVALFQDIKNAAFLHQQLLAGNTDFEYALIDASILVSKLHALAAAYQAVNDLIGNRLRSRNVHSEIVFSLSPNNNIAESFRRFGISPTTSNLLIMKLSHPSHPSTAAAVQSHLAAQVQGVQVEFSDEVLGGMTDVARVRKIYKLNLLTAGGGGKGKGKIVNLEEEEERRELEMLVLGSLALKKATN